MDKKRILIVGSNSFLGRDLKLDPNYFDITKIRRPYEDTDKDLYNSFDIVINFCYQNKTFFSLLPEEEMIDVNIAKQLNGKTKFVFLSSRKVYGSNPKLLKYKETDKTKPVGFYAENKVNIEKELQEILGDKLLCLRVGNIISVDETICTNGHCFMSWVYDELINKKNITVTIDKKAQKDFIPKSYLYKALQALFLNDASGIYNIGAGFGISTEELLKSIVDEKYLNFTKQEIKSEQFILDCKKLHKFLEPLRREELLNECNKLKESIEENILNTFIKN